MEEIGVDEVEQILLRSDVEDLIRCKSVCKSWQSLISTPSFVTSHLKHAYKSDRENHQLGHRRFLSDLHTSEDEWFYLNVDHIVGSYNGLVCFSPEDVKFVLSNPSTREQKKLPMPPCRPDWRDGVCWGFGYADDYKLIAGFTKSERTFFYVLTLKSNTWKFIEKVEYLSIDGKSGTLCGGALHWFMTDRNNKTVILSLDLSTLKFKEIPQPGAEYGYEYANQCIRLGVIDECLCICSRPSDFSYSYKKKWVMKNNKWEPYIDHDHCRSKYDVAHCWIKTSSGPYADDGGTRVPSDGGYAPPFTFVKSLVSPRLHDKGQEDNKSHTKGNIRKRKRRSCKAQH